MEFQETQYARRLDSVGRLMIPSALRNDLRLNAGDMMTFYIYDKDPEHTYLCIPCPKRETEVERAKRILREAGVTEL